MNVEYLQVPKITQKILTQIFSAITISNEISYNDIPCWISSKAINKRKYSYIMIEGTTHLFHRLMYSWLIEPIPKGRKEGVLDHLCRNRACVNPVHLEFVTEKINILRGESCQAKNARKTHCLRGHELSGYNCVTRHYRSANMRMCRICYNQQRKKHRKGQRDRAKLRQGQKGIGISSGSANKT